MVETRIANAPTTLGNQIRIAPGRSMATEEGKSILVHECTHVWQYQTQGTRYITCSLAHQAAAAASAGTRNAAYFNYQLNERSRFGNFPAEEQAQIVQDYYDMQYRYSGPRAAAPPSWVRQRRLGMRHYDVQMIGGILLAPGFNIAEMVTGEGKTLVATLPAYLNAMDGQRRSRHHRQRLPRPARHANGCSPSLHGSGADRRVTFKADMEASRAPAKPTTADITYGTNNEFGFDYLRDNMKPGSPDGDERYPPTRLQQCQGRLNFAIDRRGGQHPHRRGPYAADHLGPRFLHRRSTQRMPTRPIRMARQLQKGRRRTLRGQREGTHANLDGRGACGKRPKRSPASRASTRPATWSGRT